jgi:hypothetical protein
MCSRVSRILTRCDHLLFEAHCQFRDRFQCLVLASRVATLPLAQILIEARLQSCANDTIS